MTPISRIPIGTFDKMKFSDLSLSLSLEYKAFHQPIFLVIEKNHFEKWYWFHVLFQTILYYNVFPDDDGINSSLFQVLFSLSQLKFLLPFYVFFLFYTL